MEKIDAPINVGWGSKQTQFHGSLGKAAAQETHRVNAGISPDDDLFPRISWRGDGAYFVVSSLSPEGLSDSHPHRTLRVYDRQGVLQSTSEAVPGLEHPLVWRPSGNLIVSTQRFGFDGGGAGREGRHDVIFFERNGLRHGEFSLKVEHLAVKGNDSTSVKNGKWGYKVREMVWNSDSSVLAIWIEGDKGDIVQFWTTGNYHWWVIQLTHCLIFQVSQVPQARSCRCFGRRSYTWSIYIAQLAPRKASTPSSYHPTFVCFSGLNLI